MLASSHLPRFLSPHLIADETFFFFTFWLGGWGGSVETCSARVLSDGETRVSGWTLFAPTEMNVKAGQEFEEKVLLLVSQVPFHSSTSLLVLLL